MTGIVFAIVLRDLRIARRYPLSLANTVLLTPLYEMALPTLLLGAAFLIDGSAVGLAERVGTQDLAGWLGLGVLTASLLVGITWTVSGGFTTARTTGVLEHSFASPARREAFVIGGAVTGTLYTLTASVILIVTAVGLLGARYSPTGVLLSVPVLLMMLVGICGVGYLAAAVALRFRRGDGLIDLGTMLMSTFSGVSFPLTLLPEPLRLPTYLFPTTWGLDLMRHFTLSSRTLLPLGVELVALVVTSVACFALGRSVFLKTERQLRTAGTLTAY